MDGVCGRERKQERIFFISRFMKLLLHRHENDIFSLAALRGKQKHQIKFLFSLDLLVHAPAVCFFSLLRSFGYGVCHNSSHRHITIKFRNFPRGWKKETQKKRSKIEWKDSLRVQSRSSDKSCRSVYEGFWRNDEIHTDFKLDHVFERHFFVQLSINFLKMITVTFMISFIYFLIFLLNYTKKWSNSGTLN